MYKKALIGVALIAFLAVQLAASLECYTCNSPFSCKSPARVSCTNSTANTTSNDFSVIHQNIRPVNGSRSFQCIKAVYHFQNRTVARQLHGCAHPDAQLCAASLRPEYAAQNWIRSCSTCTGNLCNRNAAPALLGASQHYYVVAVTIVTLLLSKMKA